MSYMEAAWERAFEASQAEEYEWYCECEQLTAMGWTKVIIPRSNFDQMQVVGQWLRDNCRHPYEHKLNAGEFIFEREKDAMLFRLAWMS